MITDYVKNWQENPREDIPGQDERVTAAEVASAVASLPSWKAGDHEDIKAELIKFGGEHAIAALTEFLNFVWQCEYVPESWKVGTIISLHKKGDKGDPNNYRGITLISIFQKVYSNVLRVRLTNAVDLHEAQAAFRSDRSCEDHIYVLTRLVQAALKAGRPLYCFFLDVRKAYDRVWRDGLVYKLIQKGVSGKLGRVIAQLLCGTKARVRIGDTLSEVFDVTLGVGQGNPLSTILFNIFIDDLLDLLHARPAATMLPLSDGEVDKTAGLAYADDVAALSLHLEGLQGHVDGISDWFVKWRGDPSPSKCAFMVVNDTDGQEELTMRGVPVQRVEVYKYLGVLMTSQGNWDEHAAYVLNKMKRAYGYWRPLLACPALPVRVRLMFVRTFVYSAALYGSSVWEPTQAMADKMDGVARKAIRTVLHLHPRDVANETLFADTGLMAPSMLMHVAKLQWKSRITKVDADRWISANKTYRLEGRRGPGRPHAGTCWQQSVQKIIEDVQHTLNLTSPFESADGQRPRARRSRRGRVVPARGGEEEVHLDASRRNIANNVWAADMTHTNAELYVGQEDTRAPWYMDCVERLGNSRAQYLDVLPCRDARIVMAARSGRLCALEEPWENKKRGDMRVWTQCPRCNAALGGSVDACLHRVLFCPASSGPEGWAELKQAALEADVSITNLDCAGEMSRGDCCTLLTEMLQPRRLPHKKAVTYWKAVVQVLKSEFTDVQVEEVEGDQGQDEDAHLILHAQFASQASGVVNVHDVDAAM